MRTPFRLFLVAATAMIPTALVAQGVTVQSVSDMRFFGGLGAVMSMAARMSGTNMHAIQTTDYVSGHRSRIDTEGKGTIIDVDAGRFTTIDHKQKTFTSMTFAEMMAGMEQAQRSAQADAQKRKAEQARDPKAAKGDMSVKYKVDVVRPGQHEKIAGYDAERVQITITLEGEATPEGEKTQAVGSMVFFLDQWMSNSAPQIAAMKEFQRAYAEKMGRAFREQAAGMSAAFASDPRLKEGMEAAAKELQKVPGISLRSTTYAALVPNGLTFDSKLVLADASNATKEDKAKADEKPKSSGLKGLMGALKAAADEQDKKGADDKSGKAPPPPKQATMMSVTNEVSSITSGAIPSSMFDPPAGYREVKPRQP